MKRRRRRARWCGFASRSPNKLGERIQKVLARSGLGSRRQIERWIVEGRIIVDGRPATLGERLEGRERIQLDGRPVELREAGSGQHSHLIYYKPAGEISSRRDPEGRRGVFDGLPRPRRGRWISVGRLDLNTSGLLLLTTDGELAHRLMHPRYEIVRGYAVRLLGELNDDEIRTLLDGVELDDGPARFEGIEPAGGDGANRWYDVRLREGRNREIRRMFEALGRTVSRLIRTRYGPVVLGRMRRGESRPLERDEVAALYAAVDLPNPGAK